MPTTRPRLVITETDAVARAINAAADRWPADAGSRSKLLLHLVEEGHRQLTDERSARRTRRLAALSATSGVLTGSYEPGYLERLREDWPE